MFGEAYQPGNRIRFVRVCVRACERGEAKLWALVTRCCSCGWAAGASVVLRCAAVAPCPWVWWADWSMFAVQLLMNRCSFAIRDDILIVLTNVVRRFSTVHCFSWFRLLLPSVPLFPSVPLLHAAAIGDAAVLCKLLQIRANAINTLLFLLISLQAGLLYIYIWRRLS